MKKPDHAEQCQAMKERICAVASKLCDDGYINALVYMQEVAGMVDAYTSKERKDMWSKEDTALQMAMCDAIDKEKASGKRRIIN